MKRLIRLLTGILQDSSIWCSTSTTRDLETITRRIKHEGLSFLMITLPNFCSDFEKSLERGYVADDTFRGFQKRGALPEFLRGLLQLVFDPKSGVLLDKPNVQAIFFIRQTCLMMKKVEHECSDARVQDAFTRFIETNDEVREWELNHDRFFRDDFGTDSSSFHECLGKRLPTQHFHFRRVADMLWNQEHFGDELFLPEALVPKHGPGATAQKVSANSKYEWREWHTRLENCFPSDLFLIPNWNMIEALDTVEFVDPEFERPVRVIQVPKTLKTPRIIAIEPVCMQYAQQALLEVVVPILEKSKAFNGALGFTDQTVNQDWAQKSSFDGSLATIDLKDASDRVSASLVWDMLTRAPQFREALFACRSLKADVPGFGVRHLSRFASMGSAMCFPIEAMVFYTIVISAISRSTGRRLSKKLLQEISSQVRIYGDDIIVPVEYVQSVMSELEYFNLRVNTNKSFYTGKFRESCGLDAYDGVPVTPVYCRRMLPTSPQQADQMLSAVSLRNQLYKAGCWITVEWLDTYLQRLAPMPVVTDTSVLLGRNSFLGYQKGLRWDANLHHWTVKGLVVKSRPRPSILDGIGALMKFFLKRGVDPSFDKKHLQFAGRPVSVYTKTQWAAPY